MRNWMLRGLAFAAAMVVVRLVQGALINAWQTQAGLISVVLLLLYVIGVIVWGLRDGRADARATADPDRRQDLAMVWLLAGLLAGILSGAVSWLIALFYTGLYTGGLLNEVTTFAAFTALLVFVPGIIGVAIGRWRVDRNPPPDRPGSAPDDGRADTDVFSAVRADETPTGEPATQPQASARSAERTSSVATVERDAPTEAIPTAQSERTTESIPTTDDAKTEVIRTDTDPRHARPTDPEQR
jgi:MFS family permease